MAHLLSNYFLGYTFPQKIQNGSIYPGGGVLSIQRFIRGRAAEMGLKISLLV